MDPLAPEGRKRRSLGPYRAARKGLARCFPTACRRGLPSYAAPRLQLSERKGSYPSLRAASRAFQQPTLVGLADSPHPTLLLSDAKQILLTSNVHPPVMKGRGWRNRARQAAARRSACSRWGLAPDVDLLLAGFFRRTRHVKVLPRHAGRCLAKHLQLVLPGHLARGGVVAGYLPAGIEQEEVLRRGQRAAHVGLVLVAGPGDVGGGDVPFPPGRTAASSVRRGFSGLRLPSVGPHRQTAHRLADCVDQAAGKDRRGDQLSPRRQSARQISLPSCGW